MSTPSSPPVSAAYVPYQAYKSKRHSHTLSSSTAHLTPNQSPPPVSRPPSSAVDTLTLPPKLVLDGESEQIHESTRHVSPTSLLVPQQTHNSHTISTQHGLESVSSLSSGFLSSNPTEPQTSVELQATPQSKVVVAHQAPKISTPSPGPSNSQSVPKKGSTFRRVQPKSTRPKLSATHSRESSSSSPAPVLHKVQGNADNRPPAPAPTTSLPVISTPTALIHPLPSISPPPIAERSTSLVSQQSYTSFGQASSQDRSAILRTTSTSTAPDNEGLILNISGNSSPLPTRKPAPYRPGFQPKGVYRPLTDEFLAIRRTLHEGDGEGGMKRVERTKLERRLEKLIDLHFPRHTFEDGTKESLQPDKRPVLRSSKEARRASSFFDFQTLRNLNINDAGDLWRGVVSGSLGDPVRNDIRAAEQRITPWQDDAAVSKCPLCSALFHALTNRKHHCRLCGQIVCSLPIKLHQRKVLCSSLFVVDSETHQIEEVGEGVDYGVRRRRTDSISGNQGRQIEEDKFLKGVRICRECRPVLLKQQYYQQTRITPPFALLYTDFIRLESAIEESLPKFQELIMSLNHHDQPTKEASAARKRLLDSFAQYDKLSKKIRGLPCPNGPGSSQDRVQAAILTRANLFLQKNMFPLQSLPTPHSGKGAGTPNSQNDGVMNTPSTMSADVDAALAQKLQPLLEQEALLESFVEEAQTQRKFEDVKTLKVNLLEIRQEIERLLQAVPKGSRNSLSEVK